MRISYSLSFKGYSNIAYMLDLAIFFSDQSFFFLKCNRLALTAVQIMPSKMEVTSQHCDTVPNKAKDILDTVNIERNVKHDSRAQHPVQSSVRGMLRVPRTFIFSLGKLRSIERFRIVETVEIVETIETVDS